MSPNDAIVKKADESGADADAGAVDTLRGKADTEHDAPTGINLAEYGAS